MSALADKDAAANLAVKNLAAARKFYEGTLGLKQVGAEGDHLIAYRSGRSMLLVYQSQYAGSNKATAAVTTWDGSVPAIDSSANRSVIYALAASVIKGHLRYVSAPDQTGPRFLVDVWLANVSPDGDLPFLGTDFSAFNLKGVALQDVTKPDGQQYARVIEL